MKRRTVTSDLLLLLTAAIWGFAFVAQRKGMDHVGPMTFNGIRFALGALALWPWVWRRSRVIAAIAGPSDAADSPRMSRPGGPAVAGSVIAGVVLFFGAAFQQAGLVHTTAGKAGFITGMYVVLVPLIGLFWGKKSTGGTWTGVFLAAIGLYLLSVTETLTIGQGDLLVLGSAFFWAAHVHVIDWLVDESDALLIAFRQFLICSGLSLIAAVAVEPIAWASIRAAAGPILYAGLISVGVAYTLQIVAQKDAHPSHAAIILSLEAVFAAIGGALFLDESLSWRERGGCSLMMAGMLASQISLVRPRRSRNPNAHDGPDVP